MFKLIHTIEDANGVISHQDTLHTFHYCPTVKQIQGALRNARLPYTDCDAINAVMEGCTVLIDCRDNCIRLEKAS